MGVGKLIRLANAEFNGKKATAKVNIVSDFEHKCFNINFDTVIHLIEKAKSVLGLINSEVTSAKDILVKLGLLGGGGSGAGISLYQYLKHKRGRKAEKIIDKTKDGQIILQIDGDKNHIVINPHIYTLSHRPDALRAVRDTFSPIGVDGFDRMESKTRLGDRKVVGEVEFSPDDAQAILASCNSVIEDEEGQEPDVEQTTAWLTVYSPVFDLKAPIWRFRMNDKIIDADVSETRIAENALARGGATVSDAYEVRIEIITPRDPSGKKGKPAYKILKVNKFVPGSPTVQASLFE